MSPLARRLLLASFAFDALIVLVLCIYSPQVDLLGRLLDVPINPKPADAVVVMSTGKIDSCQAGPEYFDRELKAAELMKLDFSTAKTMIISGVYTTPSVIPVAECTATLHQRLGFPEDVKLIVDNDSQTTADNARNIAKIMRAHHWQSAVLVTARSHMMRGMLSLQKQGITVHPYPVPDLPPPIPGEWFGPTRRFYVERFLYEVGALLKYKWYGTI